MERYLIFGDVQSPLHDRRLWKNFVQFVSDYQPDRLYSVGDFTDSTELGRWVRGLKGEYTGTLQTAFDTSHGMLAQIRDVYDGPFEIVRSNHDDRLELYLERQAPALAPLRDLTIESQLHLDELDIQFNHKLVDLAPGWVMAHGDEGNVSAQPGMTALKLARKIGKSVVCGHSHRAGLTAESVGYNGRNYTLWGVDAGHMMDMNRAGYLKTGAGNWQQAAGVILYVDGRVVQPSLIPSNTGRFIVEGQKYG